MAECEHPHDAKPAVGPAAVTARWHYVHTGRAFLPGRLRRGQRVSCFTCFTHPQTNMSSISECMQTSPNKWLQGSHHPVGVNTVQECWSRCTSPIPLPPLVQERVSEQTAGPTLLKPLTIMHTSSGPTWPLLAPAQLGCVVWLSRGASAAQPGDTWPVRQEQGHGREEGEEGGSTCQVAGQS